MNKTNDFKYNLPAYSDPVDIEDLNDNFRGIDDALMAGLCKKDYTGNNMGSSDPSARKYAWAPWLEIVNDNEFDVVVTDRNAPVGSEEATINIAAGQTFRKYINGRYYMNFYVQDQHDVTFKWFTNAETYINESGGGGGGTGTVTSVSVQGGNGSHLTGSGNPIETSGTITINVDEGYSIPSDNEQTAWDGKAADLKFEINSSTFVITAQLKDSSGNLIGNERTIDLPLETMVVDGEYDPQTQKIKLELKNGNYVEFSVADLVGGLQTELSASNKLDPDYIDYDADHRAVSDTEKNTWSGKQNALTFDDTPTQNSNNPVKSGGIYSALAGKQASLDSTQLAAVNSGIDSAKVGQISTNQTNILYGLNTGVKNWFDVAAEGNSQYGLSAYSADTTTGTVKVASTTSSGSWARYRVPITLPAGTYTISGNVTELVGYLDITGNTNVDDQGTAIISRITRSSTGNFSSDFTINSETSFYVAFYANYSGTAQNRSATVEHMMISPKSIYDQDSSFQSPSLPNYDLTRLEAEDRASLAEVVDSGAKNILKLVQPSGSGVSGNPNLTVTVNETTGHVTLSGSTTSNGLIYISGIYNTIGGYILSGKPSVTEDYMLRVYSTSDESGMANDPGNGNGSVINGNQSCRTALYVYANKTFNNVTIKPMICTKAAFGVSNKFVPYRPNYDLVCNRYNSTCLIKTYEYTPTAADTYEELPPLKITLPSGKMLRITASAIFQVAYAKGIMLIRGNTVGDTYTLAKQESDTGLNTLAVSTAYTAGSAQDIHVYVKANSKAAIKVVVVYDII